MSVSPKVWLDYARENLPVDSKYPTPSVIPHQPPSIEVCRRCVDLPRKVLDAAERIIAAAPPTV